jgi:hypothetical protein
VTTHVELYRALEPHVGEEAAQLIADAVPPAANLATKEDLAGATADLRKEMAAMGVDLRTEMAAMRADLRLEIAGLRSDIFRWNLVFFVPLWLGVWGTLAAFVVKELA